MDSQGTVTATFTWNRTGGITDNPPATVWINETPSAKYSGGGMGATSTGSASNGIVPSVDVTGGKDSTCSRLVKVTVSSDTAVITSPQMAAICDFTPASGGTVLGSLTVSYTASVSTITAEIQRDAGGGYQAITSSNNKVLPGQQMNLKVVVSGMTPSTYGWLL